MFYSLIFHLAFLRAHLESDRNIEENFIATLVKLIANCEDFWKSESMEEHLDQKP